MKQLSIKTLLEYRYESEEEAERHECIMISDGWKVDSKKSYFIKHYRSYSQSVPVGAFL